MSSPISEKGNGALSPGNHYKQNAIRALNSSINSSLNGTSVTQSTESKNPAYRFVKVLVPIEALNKQLVDVSVEEYSAKSVTFKLMTNEAEDIKNALTDFLKTNCTPVAQTDRQLISNIFQQLKDNFGRPTATVPKYVKRTEKLPQKPIPVPAPDNALARIYDESIDSFLEKRQERLAEEYTFKPTVNKKYANVTSSMMEKDPRPVEDPDGEEMKKLFKVSKKNEELAEKYRQKVALKLVEEIKQRRDEINTKKKYLDTEAKKIKEQEKKETEEMIKKHHKGEEEKPAEQKPAESVVEENPFKFEDIKEEEYQDLDFDKLQSLMIKRHARKPFEHKVDQYFIVQEREKKELEASKECTFQPEITKMGREVVFEEKNFGKRQFIQQAITQQKIKKSRNDVNNKRNVHNTFKPQIDPNSEKIAIAQGRSSNIYQKLQNEAKAQQIMKVQMEQVIPDPECTFKPNISQVGKQAQSKLITDLQNPKQSPVREKEVPTGAFLQQNYLQTFRDYAPIITKQHQQDEKQTLFERLHKEGEEHLNRRKQFESWGETMNIMLANTIHTNARSGQIIKKEQKAIELFQIMKAENDFVTGTVVAENAQRFHKNGREKIKEWAEFIGDKEIAEWDFVRAFAEFE
ncbi:Conserved_hypothetical protein [Hexamita inflata]|uniref:Uncharacterized protein n=1 Tax=Hexamita inflata TaxID=28002 RepID=A0AA86Q3I2_9EUKA|nr:Conserved hypothetical protein [Hexamita inflata]